MTEEHAICYCGKPIHTETWASGMKPIWMHDEPRRGSCNPEGGLPIASPNRKGGMVPLDAFEQEAK